MIVEFDYYLHDNYNTMERLHYIREQIGGEMTTACAENIGNPFYEVQLRCSLDTETGEVKIISVNN